MRKYFFIFSLITILFSCNSKQENQVDVSAIKVDFSIDRFDVDFYATTENSLFKTKEKCGGRGGGREKGLGNKRRGGLQNFQ